MCEAVCLDDLKPGQKARIKSLSVAGSMRRRFLDIGLTKDTIIECLGKSPAGDPKAFLIRGAVIAIRCCDCRNIFIHPIAKMTKGEVHGTDQTLRRKRRSAYRAAYSKETSV